MDEIDKRIHLSFFVLLFMNLFYALIDNSYIYIFYFIFALIVAYFVVYPDKFFLIWDNTRKFSEKFINTPKIIGDNRISLAKGNTGTNLHIKMENNRDEDERQTQEGISEENIKSSRKRVGNSLYY